MQFKTINVGRGYVINVGRGYVRNDKGRHRAARAAKKHFWEKNISRIYINHILIYSALAHGNLHNSKK